MFEFVVKGRVIKYGDDINTDDIIPGWWTVKTNELGRYAFWHLEGEGGFMEKVGKGFTIVVGGKHFGTGSSREHAPVALKQAGVKGICAEFFARIFFRNCINVGLPVIECRGITHKVKEGDTIKINFETGEIKNLTTGDVLYGTKVPPFLWEIINNGGLISHLKKKGR